MVCIITMVSELRNQYPRQSVLSFWKLYYLLLGIKLLGNIFLHSDLILYFCGLVDLDVSFSFLSGGRFGNYFTWDIVFVFLSFCISGIICGSKARVKECSDPRNYWVLVVHSCKFEAVVVTLVLFTVEVSLPVKFIGASNFVISVLSRTLGLKTNFVIWLHSMLVRWKLSSKKNSYI